MCLLAYAAVWCWVVWRPELTLPQALREFWLCFSAGFALAVFGSWYASY